jgi:hypothetical protein
MWSVTVARESFLSAVNEDIVKVFKIVNSPYIHDACLRSQEPVLEKGNNLRQ